MQVYYLYLLYIHNGIKPSSDNVAINESNFGDIAAIPIIPKLCPPNIICKSLSPLFIFIFETDTIGLQLVPIYIQLLSCIRDVCPDNDNIIVFLYPI